MNLHSTLQTQPLVCDGAMGTMLHAAGNSLDQALPALNLSAPERVRRIHDSYVGAGVDILQTNTFGASRLRLAQYGFDTQVEQINHAGVRLARAATDVERPILVAGSVSPAVTVQQRRRADHKHRKTAVREQISALLTAGVDMLLLETFGYLSELIEAVEIAAQFGDTPIIAQATFGSDAHTLSGHTPYDVTTALADLPIAAFGTNCTLGPQRSLAVVRQLHTHSALPLTVQPNAGLPRRIAAARFEYDLDADYFTRYIRRLLDAGAAIIGGCCGTTPTHLAAAVQAAEDYQQHTARSSPATTQPEATEPAAAQSVQERLLWSTDVTAIQLSPPLAGSVEETLETIHQVDKTGVGLVSIAPSHSNYAQVNTINLAVHVHQQTGLPTMASVTTTDRTIMALQADLLGAHALGLHRIVCETGTPPLLGDYPHVDGIWDVDSIGFIELLANLNQGLDYNGLGLPSKTNFNIGARINPGSTNMDRATARTLEKITAGAHFLVTRPIYELTGLKQLLSAIDGRVPVLVALHPLSSHEEAEYLAHEVPDVTIPSETLAALARAGKHAPEVGLELTAELRSQVQHLANGILIVPSQQTIAADVEKLRTPNAR